MNQRERVFELLNNYFDKIYIITLKKSTDRHDNLKKLADGLNYEVFWGVDGSKLDLGELGKQGLYESHLAKQAKLAMKTEPKDMTMGAIGCALSHNGIYKKMLDEGHQRVLILEDDITINFSAAETLENAFKEIPEDWELFYLGYLYNNNSISFSAWYRLYFAYPIVSALGFKQYDPKRFRCKFPRPYSDHLNRSGFHYGTHAYALSAQGAKKILDSHTPIHRESDNAIAYMCMHEMINAFNITDRVFHQNREKFGSTITVQDVPARTGIPEKPGIPIMQGNTGSTHQPRARVLSQKVGG